MINGNKLMIEINLHCDGKWTLVYMGKNICLEKIGAPDNFQLNKKSIHSILEIVRQLRYCNGVKEAKCNEHD